MKQIGNSIKMYLMDYDDTFPTNRPYTQGHKLGPISAYVRLSPDENGEEGKPVRHRYGINWVESLHPYVEQATKKGDATSTWRCEAASKKTYPSGSDTARVTYVFNRNLAEKSEGIITEGSRLLMIRESDRLLNAELRPTNDTTWASRVVPDSPFLTDWDSRIGKTQFVLHGTGSTVLFADGHVKLIDAQSMPSHRRISKARCWDPKARKWYNRGLRDYSGMIFRAQRDPTLDRTMPCYYESDRCQWCYYKPGDGAFLKRTIAITP